MVELIGAAGAVRGGVPHPAAGVPSVLTGRRITTPVGAIDRADDYDRARQQASALLEEAGIAMPGWESDIDAVLGAYLDAKTASKTASCYCTGDIFWG